MGLMECEMLKGRPPLAVCFASEALILSIRRKLQCDDSNSVLISAAADETLLESQAVARDSARISLLIIP